MRRAITVTIAAVLLISVIGLSHLGAASAFADPAFKQQWDQGEALAPNFWGPLANAHDGQQEPYKEAPGGQRLVQYFDKGRMELTNGAVTNGLLATEMVKGQLQTGDNQFQSLVSPSIPIAGDPDNPGPTYAGLATKAATLCAPAQDARGIIVIQRVSAAGDVTTAGPFQPSTPATISVYDSPTRHNVPKAFVDYRDTAGLPAIGYAICEPFVAAVKVAGTQRTVLVQVFERRVLTFNPDNPPAFQVEMGNIGQHYYQWRYGSVPPLKATQAALTGAASPIPAAPTTPPTVAAATAKSAADVTFTSIQGAKPGNVASVTVQTAPGATCAIRYSTPKGTGSTAQGLSEKTADSNGYATWSFLIGGNTTPGTGSVTVTCNGTSRSASLVIS